LLDEEVCDVMSWDPSVRLNKPRLWVNSQPALLVQNAIEDDAPRRTPRRPTAENGSSSCSSMIRSRLATA
jgi:hypothetical protein